MLQSYTQYIPLPITDLESWLKTPSIYVFDCSAAGIIVKAFLEVCYMLLINICFSVLEDEGYHDLWACFVFVPGLSNIQSDFCLLQRLDWSSSSSASAQKDCILLAACEAHQSLPQSAEFPADLFTACLTTPIKMALHWFSFSLFLSLLCLCMDICVDSSLFLILLFLACCAYMGTYL